MLSAKFGEESQAFLATVEESKEVGQTCGGRVRDVEASDVVNSGGYLHRMVQSALQKFFVRDNASRPMSTLRCSTFAAITLTVLERLSRNSGGQMLSGRGTSSHNEKSNKQGASQIRLMQALVNTASRQENEKD